MQWVRRNHLAREDLMSLSLSFGSRASRADESRRMSQGIQAVWLDPPACLVLGGCSVVRRRL